MGTEVPQLMRVWLVTSYLSYLPEVK